MATTRLEPARALGRPSAPRLGTLLEAAGTLLVLFFVAFPILWLTLAAFRNEIDVYSTRLFSTPTLENFRLIFTEPLFLGPKVLNSVIVSGLTILITIPLGAMAAYALSRYRFPYGNAIFVGILTTQFIPAVVVAIPFFTLFRQLGLIDTLTGLVIVNLSLTLPYAIWLLKGFFDALPTEIEEAAFVDGCTELQVMRFVTLPLVAPGLIVSAVFAFITAWNEFFFAFTLTRSNAQTLMIGLLNTQGVRGIMWEQMAAAGLIVMVPIFILSLFIRKHFVQGLTMGAVK